MQHRLILIWLVIFTTFTFSCSEEQKQTLVAEPGFLDLGIVGINDTVVNSLTISNNKNKDITLENFAFVNDDENEFFFRAGNDPITVPAGGSVTIEIGFTPTEIGKKSIKVHIAYTTKNKILKIKIKAEAQDSSLIEFEPEIKNYGKVVLFEDAVHGFRFSNPGTLDLLITDMKLTGDFTEFEIMHTEKELKIPSFDTTVIDIKFTPQFIGKKQAVFMIFHNAINIDSPLEINIIGEGVNSAPKFSINPDSWNFGSVIENNSIQKEFQIQNTGNLDLYILTIKINSDHPDCFIITSGFAPFLIAPKASKSITIDFTPKTRVNFSATFDITHNGVSSPSSIQLQGKGIEGIRVIFAEDWNATGGTFPSGWIIDDGGTNNGSNYSTWFLEGGGNNNTGGNGYCASCDSHQAGTSTTLEEVLTSPEIDCSTWLTGTINVEFDGNFQYYSNSFVDYATFEVFDGVDWVVLDTYDTSFNDFYGGEHKRYDVSQEALGNPNFKIRFYYAGKYDWFLQVDNIEVTYTP